MNKEDEICEIEHCKEAAIEDGFCENHYQEFQEAAIEYASHYCGW